MTKFKIGVLMVAAILCGGTALRAAESAAPETAAVKTEGVVEGILVAKGDGWVEIRPDGKDTVRYRALWIGGMPANGGGFEAAMVKTIKNLRVPNRVRLTWKTVEGPRVVAIETLEPKDKSGQGFGIVTAKGENWIEIKTEGVTERYSPRWFGGLPKNGGGLDQKMIRAIAERSVGDKVRFEWIYDERKRVVVLVPDTRK